MRPVALDLPVGSDAPVASSGRAVGLRIDSDYLVRGLQGATGPADEGRAVRLELVSAATLQMAWPASRARGVASKVGATVEHHPQAGYLVTVSCHGSHLIDPDGRRVRSAPVAMGAELWQRVLGDQVLPLAATLQGLEVFRASAVIIAGSVIAMVGPVGAGKTAVAAHLILRGARFFADDVVALETRGPQIVAHAGLGVARLRASRSRLAPALAANGVGTVIDEGGTLVEMGRDVAALPLRILYFLGGASERAETTITTQLPHPLALLRGARAASVNSPERLRRQLDLVCALSSRARLFRAAAPPGGERELARAIFEHAAREARR